MWVFLKNVGFFLKNSKIIKIGKGGKFAVECVSSDIVSYKCFSYLKCEVFLQKQKSEKFQNLKNWRI